MKLSYNDKKIIEIWEEMDKYNRKQTRKENKILNSIKDFVYFNLLMFLTISAFGGGAIWWITFCMLFGFEGTILQFGCYISLIIFSILGFWLTPKISDKIL